MKSLILIATCVTVSGLLLGRSAMVMAEDKPPEITCPSDMKGTAKCDYYKEGWKLGSKDRSESKKADYKRHAARYDSQFEDSFQKGYNDAYSASAFKPGKSLKE